MGLNGQERRLGHEPMLTCQEIAALRVHPATGRGWRVGGNGPAYFKIGPLHRHPGWKLKRWLSQLCRPEAVA